MKKLISKISVAIFGFALLAGCQSPDHTASNNNGAGSVADPTQITLLFSKPAKPYTDVGGVSAVKRQKDASETWQHRLQKQAASLGADAVLVDTGTLNNPEAPMVNGTAIRYNK